VILQLQPDVICLQEFCFKTQGFLELYEELLGERFSMNLLKRTRSKPEGIAILTKKGVFEQLTFDEVKLEPYFCDRVAIVMTALHIESGHRISVANTHLTVAHVTNDHDVPMCRPRQIEQVLEIMSLKSPEVLPFICADMNSDHWETCPPKDSAYTCEEISKPVHDVLRSGYVSALHETIEETARPISHVSSYSQDGCVDYCFYRPNEVLTLSQAFLYPECLPFDEPWDPATGWAGGMDRPVLSDHRPLIVDFVIMKRE